MRKLIPATVIALSLASFASSAQDSMSPSDPVIGAFVQMSLHPRFGAFCGAVKIGKMRYLTAASCTREFLADDNLAELAKIPASQAAVLSGKAPIYLGRTDSIVTKITYPAGTLSLFASLLLKLQANEEGSEEDVRKFLAQNYAILEMENDDSLPSADLSRAAVIATPSPATTIEELANNQPVMAAISYKPGYYEAPVPLTRAGNILSVAPDISELILQGELGAHQSSMGGPVWVQEESGKLVLAGIITAPGNHPLRLNWIGLSEAMRAFAQGE